MFNPMQMLSQVNGASNPMSMMQEGMMQQFQSNPMFQRAQQMANGKSNDEIQQICKNLCEQRGVSVDEMMKQFQQQYNGK